MSVSLLTADNASAAKRRKKPTKSAAVTTTTSTTTIAPPPSLVYGNTTPGSTVNPILAGVLTPADLPSQNLPNGLPPESAEICKQTWDQINSYAVEHKEGVALKAAGWKLNILDNGTPGEDAQAIYEAGTAQVVDSLAQIAAEQEACAGETIPVACAGSEEEKRVQEEFESTRATLKSKIAELTIRAVDAPTAEEKLSAAEQLRAANRGLIAVDEQDRVFTMICTGALIEEERAVPLPPLPAPTTTTSTTSTTAVSTSTTAAGTVPTSTAVTTTLKP